MQISFEGMDNVIAKMKEAGYNVEKLKNALAKAGEIVRADAAANCPVDTGELRDSIVSQVVGNSAFVGPTAKHGIFVEFGTGAGGDPKVAHTTKKTWTYYKGGRFYTTSGQAPQPYLVPALLNSTGQILQAFKDVYRG